MPALRTLAALLLVAPAPALAQYAAGREVKFTVHVENVSTAQTLKLSNGTAAPAPTAPLLWTITDNGNPLFTAGKPDRGHGLEQLAEDGNPGVLSDYIVTSQKSVLRSGIVTIPTGDKEAGPILPGKSYDFTVAAAPGQKLTLAMMFGQSNDLFYAPGAKGIALFDANGMPITRDVTSELLLWDAGTEVNQEPGLGSNQAARQPVPNTGPAERGTVRLARDRYTYPKTAQVIRVTVTAGAAASAAR